MKIRTKFSVTSVLISLLLDEFSHRVVPFLADFHKDVVKLVDLLDGLAGLTVERDQDKLPDRCRVEREKEKQEEKETKEKNEGHRFSLKSETKKKSIQNVFLCTNMHSCFGSEPQKAL